MDTRAAHVTAREIALPAPVFLLAMAVGVTLLFSLALNAMLDSTSIGPAAGARAATFSTRGDPAGYEPGPRLTFARQRPLTAEG